MGQSPTLAPARVVASVPGAQRLVTALRHGSAFLGVVAVAKGVVSVALLDVGLRAVAPAMLVGFLGAAAIYTHNKGTDLAEDAVDKPERAAFAASRRGVLYGACAAAFGLALGVAALAGVWGVLITFAPGAAAVIYGHEWVPLADADRLKDIAVVNTAIVAGMWAMPVAFLPLAFAEVDRAAAALVVAALVFLRTAAAAEVANVRDVAGDRRAGVSTVPTRFGVRRTRHLLYAIDALTVGLLAGAVRVGVVTPVEAAAFVPALALSAVVARRVRRGAAHGRLAVAKDAEYLLAAVCLLAVGAV